MAPLAPAPSAEFKVRERIRSIMLFGHADKAGMFSGKSPAVHSVLALPPRRIEAPDGEVERASKRNPCEVG